MDEHRIYRNEDALLRVRETLTFAGRDMVIVECLDRGHADIRSVHPRHLANLGPADESEWAKALAVAEKAEAKRRARHQAHRDGKRWGIEVEVRGRSSEAPRLAVIIRSTRTQLIDVDGGRWTRRTGRQVGGAGRAISRQSRMRVEEFLAGRDRVDIVAERKAAGQ